MLLWAHSHELDAMIAETLRDLNDWYDQSTSCLERMLLISKLANIELGGWLEEEFDRLIIEVAENRISDMNWLGKSVIKKNYGFSYKDHWRVMLTKIVGEMYALRVEKEMESEFPTELAQLTSLLTRLWDERCKFAHSDLEKNMNYLERKQLRFNAPSQTFAEYNQIKKILGDYKLVLFRILPDPSSQ